MFHSGKWALLILVNVSMAPLGGLLALLLTAHQLLSVSSGVGFLALFGVSVQTGVIMLEYINQMRVRGHSIEEAAIEGAVLRLRPIMMTMLVATLGLLPAATSHGIGSDSQRPFAIVIVGGLIGALVISVFLLPTLYVWIARPTTSCPSRRPNLRTNVTNARVSSNEIGTTHPGTPVGCGSAPYGLSLRLLLSAAPSAIAPAPARRRLSSAPLTMQQAVDMRPSEESDPACRAAEPALREGPGDPGRRPPEPLPRPSRAETSPLGEYANNPYDYSAGVGRLFERGEKRRWRLDSARSTTAQTDAAAIT